MDGGLVEDSVVISNDDGFQLLGGKVEPQKEWCIRHQVPYVSRYLSAMARKKRLLDDGDSDSSRHSEDDFDFNDDPSAHRKRRRTDRREDALYGVFGDDSEDDASGANAPQSSRGRGWAKAPAFVSSDKKVDINLDVDVDVGADSPEGEDAVEIEDAGSEGEDDQSQTDNESSDNSEPSRPPSPRIRSGHDGDEELERPIVGGIGMGAFKPDVAAPSLSSSGMSGIGSSKPLSSTPSEGSLGPAPELPSAFGKGAQRSFVRNINSPKPQVPLSAGEMANFQKISGSFGAKMLAKMGWQVGTGLGLTGEGIVTPVESKLRPQKMGIAFKGFKEKTEQSKMEARRRGEVVSDDEDMKAKKLRKKAKEQEQKRADAWKKPKKIKTKLEHKTYEQILAEAGHEVPPANIGQIIDATGAVPREVSSITDLSLNAWSPSSDSTRIPEVRFNIRLIADACKSDLDGLAREAKVLDERKKYATSEDTKLRKKLADEAELIERLQKVHLVVQDINAKSKDLSQVYEISLEPFSPLFYALVEQFSREFERYQLDEVVVAAIAPSVRRMVANWSPLQDPKAFISTFRTWRRALRVNTSVEKPPDNQCDTYGSRTRPKTPPEILKPMTPFESLLWNVWLPRVRTCINNDWSPNNPQPAVMLYEAWSTFLPPFIRDNLFDQLILPKVQKAIANWIPKRNDGPLQAIVFPWLPHVGLRMNDLVGDAHRKIKNLLKAWLVGDDVPAELPAWKDLFDTGEWDSMLLKYIVPKLGSTLRNDFHINPRDQRMEPLERVLQWMELIRPSVFSQILETGFFPKWLDVLHLWLIQPTVSFEEVAQWYSFWKGSFPEAVQDLAGISRGFTRGLQLMNKAIELGPDAPSRLARPDFGAEHSALDASVRNGTKDKSGVAKLSARRHEITFRSIVEEFASSHNLLFIPTGRAHEVSRMPLFRVSPTADGKGGILVYILDDAVWTVVDGKEYGAISLDDMVLRANT